MPTIQNYGTISNIPITKDGETRTLTDWCQKLGLAYRTAYMRWTRGIRDPDELLFVPHHKQDATGTWVHYGRVSDLKRGQGIQTGFALVNILSEELAAQVRQFSEQMDMTPDEVIITFVEHGVKKLQKAQPTTN